MAYTSKQLQILEGVLTLLEEGVDLRTVRASQIAQRAGIGKSTLYEHFVSKEDILAKSIFLCVTRQFERFLAALEQAQSFEEACTRVMEMVAASAHEQRAAFLVLVSSLGGEQLAACKQEGRAFFAERAQQITEQMDDLLRRGQQEGALGPITDAAYARHAMLSAFLGYSDLVCLFRGRTDPETLKRRTYRMLVASLNARETMD